MTPAAQHAPARITLVVPTRNRAHTLRLVAPSFYAQELVDEIIFVDDGGNDETETALRAIAAEHPGVRTLVLRNAVRRGAPACRNRGVAAARNAYVLFCDDDEMLERGYARTCLDLLLGRDAAAVSGRRIYMQAGETPDQALRRFGAGLRRAPPFRRLLCEYVNGARFEGEVELPFTNANILTHAHLLREFGFDEHYAQGNGYREETDYQMNLFVHGHRILVTGACHSFHLPPGLVRTGGQRVRAWQRVRWSVHYTRYFYAKYWDRYAARVGVRAPRALALACFAAHAAYKEMLRPPLHALAMRLLRARARRPSVRMASVAGRGAHGRD